VLSNKGTILDFLLVKATSRYIDSLFDLLYNIVNING